MARNNTAVVEEVADLESVMQLTKSHVKEPALYPQGPWDIRNVGGSTSETTGNRGPQLQINLRYEGFAPLDGVDDEELQELNGAYEGRTIWVKHYISMPSVRAERDGSLAKWFRFVEMHGIDTDELDVTSSIKALKGEHIGSHLGARSFTDKMGQARSDNTAGQFFSLADIEE